MAQPKGSTGTPKKVLDTLHEHGPLTNRAIVELTGICSRYVSTALYKLHQKPKLIYIHSWEELTHNGFNTRPHACYDIGDKPDARKPPPLGHNLVCRRVRANKRKRVNSVFNLGATHANKIFQERTPPISHRNRT